MDKIISIFLLSLVLIFGQHQQASATIGSEDFCAQNPRHFVRDNKNDNDENDNEISDDNGDWTKSCRNSGYYDGQNGNFEKGTWDFCGDESGGKDGYDDVFIYGCVNADNTKEFCESFTDTG
jgi:hypothetical protein